MPAIDQWIAGFAHGPVLVLIVALLLGLRHATDPDHLTAVSTLVLSDDRTGGRRATRLGLAWGLGHATTLCAVGLPLIIFDVHLPEPVQRGAEVAIGLIIIWLAVRLLWRWKHGYFHFHQHEHGGITHAHPHVHEGTHAPVHAHQHAADLGRSPLAAYGIGLVHGVGGSAGVGLLLVTSAPTETLRVASLFLFAGATALSMALLSSAFGFGLVRGVSVQRLARVAPIFGIGSLLFGVWYAVGALISRAAP
jgi:ABC-type nickel/cobalt efflux system permease component RcnA